MERIVAQPAQVPFLASRADIAVYGGAAGGGKSFALLLEAARGTRNSRYGGVIFRRTSTQITAPGGLWDAAERLYPVVGARALRSQNRLEYVFPNGSSVAFRHLQHENNKADWQGAELPFIGFDELTHFTEGQFWYLCSRNRSTIGMRPYVRATTNPAPGWVRTLLAPWIDKSFPNPAKPGELRYFIRENNLLIWVDASYRDEDGLAARSLTFIPARVQDNAALLKANPEYIATLRSLPEIERRRLLDGDWDVFEGAFFAEFSEAIHAIVPPYTPGNLPAHWSYFGGIDWGYSSPFAAGLLAVDEDGNEHVIESFQAARLTNDAQADRVVGLLTKWGVDRRRVVFAFDPSMRNKGRARFEPGFSGEADIEAYYRAGLMCAPADNHRQAGWSRVRRSLSGKTLKIWRGYNNDLLRFFPLAPFDKDDAEDQAAGEWEHLLDFLRYALMTRPVAAIDPNRVRQPDHTPGWLKEARAKERRQKYF